MAAVRLKGLVDNLGKGGKSLLEVLFPTRCFGCGRIGEWFCYDCRRNLVFVDIQRCPRCGRSSFGGFTHLYCATYNAPERLISIFPYKGPIKKAITQFKYNQVLMVSDFMATASLEYFERYLIYFPSDFVLVPVPLHWRRRWRRTYNQSELLARKIGEKLHLSTDSTLIKRRRYAPSQTKLTPEERVRNVKGAFIVPEAKRQKVTGRNLVLVDDVWTTGATSLEVCRTLKKAKARNIWILTAARG